jgi:hypothetical protein
MAKIRTAMDLKMAIMQLENDQVMEWALLREELHTTAESLKPSNLIKETFKDISPIGLAAGYLSKALISGGSHNPLKSLLGSLLQLGITRIVSKLRDE